MNELLTTTAECSRLQSELEYSKKDLESQASKFGNLQGLYNTLRGQHEELQTKCKDQAVELERSAKMSKDELASLVKEKTRLKNELESQNYFVIGLRKEKDVLDEAKRKLQ